LLDIYSDGISIEAVHTFTGNSENETSTGRE